jgi:prophage antirepressor-like protein
MMCQVLYRHYTLSHMILITNLCFSDEEMDTMVQRGNCWFTVQQLIKC